MKLKTEHQKIRLLPAAATIGIIAAATIYAGTAALMAHATPKPKRPAILKIIPGQDKVLESAAVPNTHLTAWLIGRNTRVGVVYTPPGGHYIINGRVITRHGVDKTGLKLMRHYFLHHDFKSLGKAVKQATSIHEGHAGPLIHVFFDPNCIFCHRLWKATRPMVQAGHLQVDWIPVGVIKPSSLGKAVAILQSKHPAKALNRDEAGFNVTAEEGAITAIQHPTAAQAKPVMNNTRLMHSQGLRGTPATVFQGPRGGWHLIQGYLPASKLLKDVGGAHTQKGA